MRQTCFFKQNVCCRSSPSENFMAHFLTVLFIIIKQYAIPMILYIFFYKQPLSMHIFYAFGLYNYFLQEIPFTMPFDNWPSAGLSFFFARREFIFSSYNVFHFNNLIVIFQTVLRCNLCLWVCFKYIFYIFQSNFQLITLAQIMAARTEQTLVTQEYPEHFNFYRFGR